MRFVVPAFIAVAALSGCSWTSQVRTRAAFDLQCPEAQVEVQTLSSFHAQYGARGCGRQATYVVRDGQAMMNSPVSPTTAPVPAPPPSAPAATPPQ